jgi:hypothetical protein
MMQPGVNGSGNEQEARLPMRDWILLPLISVATIVAIAACTGSIANRMFRASKTAAEDCMVFKDPVVGTKGIPHSVCQEKIAEGEQVVYRFNGSGYRSDVEFGPKPPDTFRIVMVGSSVSLGARVRTEEAVSSRLPSELSQRTGRKVEVYNEGIAGSGGYLRMVAMRFQDAFAANPDMILWMVTSWDIQHASSEGPVDGLDVMPAPKGHTLSRIKEALAAKSISQICDALEDIAMDRVRLSLNSGKVSTMLRHFAYDSQSQYVKLYLKQGDAAGYLKAQTTPDWQSRLQLFNNYAAELEQRAKAAGVPWAVVLVPTRAQAAMASMGEWPAGYDPYKLDDEVRSIITSHGGIYIDILPDFRNIPNPELHYYPLDGHPDPDGYLLLSQLLARHLTGGAVPALAVSTQTQALSGPERRP